MTWIELARLIAAAAVLNYLIRSSDFAEPFRRRSENRFPPRKFVLDRAEVPRGRLSRWERVVADADGWPVFTDPATRNKPVPAAEDQPGVWYTAKGSTVGFVMRCPWCLGFYCAVVIVLGRCIGLGYWPGRFTWWSWAWTVAVDTGVVWFGGVAAVGWWENSTVRWFGHIRM